MKRSQNRLAIFAASIVLLISSAISAYALPLVTNGGFETGDFSGWVATRPSPASALSVDNFAYSGSYAAYMGTPYTLGSLAQTILTTPGAEYILSFQLANSGGTNEFIAKVNGITLLDIQNGDWQPYSAYALTFTADQALTDIAFYERNDVGALHLDEINVEPVPEPSTFLLFGAALFGASVFSHRRRRSE